MKVFGADPRRGEQKLGAGTESHSPLKAVPGFQILVLRHDRGWWDGSGRFKNPEPLETRISVLGFDGFWGPGSTTLDN